MAIGFGEAALAEGGAGLTGLDLIRSTARGGGEGILNFGSSLTGDADAACFCKVDCGG